MSKLAFTWVREFFNLIEKDAVETGNTGAVSRRYRGRHFQLTINNVDTYDEIYKYLTKYSTLKYLISCRETAPTTGHDHIHIYVQFSQSKILDTKNLYGAHLEVCKGTPLENRNYIIKDGNIIHEVGEFKTNGGICGHTIQDVMNMTDEELMSLDFKYYNVIQRIKHDRLKLNTNNHFKDVKVIYIYGPSGCGKSKHAYNMLNDLAVPGTLAVPGALSFDEVSFINNFWINVSNDTDFCIYDDFRDSDMKPNEFIKFIDYNVHVFNIKGGHILNTYKTIIITSIKSPWELYVNKNDEEKKQWIRRLDIYTIQNDELIKVDDIFEDI